MFSKKHKILSTLLLLVGMGIYGCDSPGNINQPSDQKNIEATAQSGDPIEGQYIVVFNKENAATGQALSGNVNEVRNSVLETNKIRKDAVTQRYNTAVQGFAAHLTDAQLANLRKDPRVDYVEQDRLVILAPPAGKGPGGGGTVAQTTPWGITRVGGATASNGTAWIIDTGVDLDHPDLNVDVNRSRTFVSKGKDSKSADDGNGHGTHVAGTIAALDNSIDVVGVASGASVVAVKVLDSRGSGSYSDVIAGVDYVAANASAGDAANMSLGGPTSQALDDAIKSAADAGVMMAIAAGNDSDDANNYSPSRVEYSNVWTVSAIDSNDQFASFSNYGNPPIEFAAPGVDIHSLWKDGGMNTISGTSMATPHVCGLLLVTGGNINSDGTAIGDPDGNPDPIAHN